MKNITKLFSFILLLQILFFVTACSDKDESNETDDNTNNADQPADSVDVNVEEVALYTLLNADFELGDLRGWRVEGDAFSVTDAIHDDKGVSYEQQRNYHVVGSMEQTGSLKSEAFRLAGSGMVSFKVGMIGNSEDTYVALYKATDDEELFKVSDIDSTAYETVEWDASSYLDEAVYFAVMDDSETAQINVDDFNYYTSNDIINPDFETGDLSGWQVIEGNAFENVIVSKDETHHDGQTFDSEGNYHLWGFAGGGDNRTGVLESTKFILDGDIDIPNSGRISLLVAGGNHPDEVYVELVRDSTGETLFKQTGFDDEVYRLVDWDATDYVGERMFFRVVDKATEGWGHINLDNIRTNPLPSTVENPDFETGNTDGWIVEGEAFKNAVTDQGDFGHHGTYHLYGFNTEDHRLTGTIQSRTFELTGTGLISFSVAGGSDPDNLYAALVRASDHEVLFKVTGSDSDEYQDVTWDAKDYLQEGVYFKMVDNKTEGPFGYISVDDFKLSADPTYYSENYRPQFHFSPESKWMNDPNGMVYYEGEYHLFYQHNPNSTVWGPMHWGHAISKDLVHWEHMPIALYPDEEGQIFSGSAVVDWDNSTGFFDDEGSGLVAIFTQAGNTIIDGRDQVQSLAYSKDNGRTWELYEGNPMLLPDEEKKRVTTSDFRDPKVFWHEETDKWVMTLAVLDRIEFFTSTDLKEWTYVSSFGQERTHEQRGVAEMTDLVPFYVDGDPNHKKWVLILSVGDRNGVNDQAPEPPAGGSGMLYYIGDFDGTTFTPDYEHTPKDSTLWMDFGADFYAAVSYSDIPAEDGRRILLGWMSNWRYANDTPSEVWRSAASIPRELQLVTTDEGIRLVQNPVEELEKLRLPLDSWENEIINSGDNLLADVHSNKFEIIAEFELDDADEFGFNVRKSDTEETTVAYNVENNTISVDRTHSGNVDFHPDFAAKHEAQLTPNNNQIKMHLIIDWSSIEFFGNDGEVVITDQIFPDLSSDGLELFTNGGDVKLLSMEIYELDSIWRDTTVMNLALDNRLLNIIEGDNHQVTVHAIVESENVSEDHANTNRLDVTFLSDYTSSDESVATVDEQGLITAQGEGMADIKVNYKGNPETITVEVTSKK